MLSLILLQQIAQLFIIIFLVGFGLVMLYSTSSYNAQVKFGNSAFYLRKQLIASLIGFGGMFIVAHMDLSLIHI